MAAGAPDVEREKDVAAARAVALVQDGWCVGLGTGSTADFATRRLAERVRRGLRITGVPTSERTRMLAVAEGIPLADASAAPRIDIAIDGADEADRELRLVKGGGGALLRERAVDSVAARFVVVCDSTKLVARLGRFPLPVEVGIAAWPVVAKSIEQLGGRPALRVVPGRGPFVTDGGNFILDASFGEIPDPEGLALRLDGLPGVAGHGLFLGLAHAVIVGRGDTTEIISRPARAGVRRRR